MSILSKPYTFSPNTTASSSEVNANFDTLYNDYNGGISAANLADNAVTTAKITDLNVTTAKLADGSVSAAKLGYSTIRLGSVTRTTIFSTNTGTATNPVAVTDMSLSFTLTEAHVVRFTFVAQSLNNSGTNFNILYICQGSADDANSVGSWRYQSTGNGNEVPVNLSTEVALNAGSYTFVVAAGTTGGTLTIAANTTGSTGMPMRFTADIVG